MTQRALFHLPLRFRRHVLAQPTGEGQNVPAVAMNASAQEGIVWPAYAKQQMEGFLVPNHVTQQLSIFGAEAPKVIEHIAGTDLAIDFNKVIPMPEEVNIEDSSVGHMGLAALTAECDRYLTFPWVKAKGIRTFDEFATYVKRERPEAIDLALEYISNKQEFGYATWRDWCIANWGTKWNAYSVDQPDLLSDRATIRFNTAWSPAIPVMVRLSELFPSVQLTLRYFDDGWNFAGEAFFKLGRHADECFTPARMDPRTRFVFHEVYGQELAIVDDEH